MSRAHSGGELIEVAGGTPASRLRAARRLAAQRGLSLSRIDSRYIGETEKNLGRLFERGAGLDAILFFDEADALFGKRSEVKDSHDRYANQEVGYLLEGLLGKGATIIVGTQRRKRRRPRPKLVVSP